MRVCFVTNFIPPYRRTFFEKLARLKDCDFVLLHGRVDRETGRPAFNGTLDTPERIVRNSEWRVGPFTIRWQVGALREVHRLRPDIVVVLGQVGTLSNWMLMCWARLTGRRVLIWACGWEPQQSGSLAWRVKQRLLNWYFGLAHQSLLYSSKGMRILAATGVPLQRMLVCYNGIEIDDLRRREPQIRDRAAALRQQEDALGAFVVLYVGGLLAEKRLDLLIDAFAAVQTKQPGMRLWIVGDGPHAGELEAHARRAGVTGLRFFGRIIDEVDVWFAAADVFVLPGLGGLAFNQALFWGVPCICAEADGTEDDLVLEGVTGWRFESGKLNSLTSALERASSAGVESRRALGEAGRQLVVERSNVSQMVATFDAAFRACAPTRSD